jgi:cytochrome c551
MKNKLLLVALTIWVTACGVPNQQESDVNIPDNLSRRDEIRFKQYLIKGKEMYLALCSNCHQSNGQGMERLYPPLANADFLNKNLATSVCMIKNGYAKPMMVNGVDYNMVMPAFGTLSPLEIAEITTYIGNKWGNKVGFIQVNQVENYLKNCD